MDAYQSSAVGFMAQFGSGSGSSADPAPTPRPAAGAISGDGRFRRVLFPQGYVSGITLARSAVTTGRSVAGDVDLLLQEYRDARLGPARNHAEGRAVGYFWQLDQALATIRDRGITLDFPPLDPGLVDKLEAL